MRPTQILIVDSDPTAAFVTQHGLQRLLKRAAKIEIAASAGEARARCLHEPIDLLIIDPASVIGTAAELVSELHSRRPDLPVLVLTAYDTPRLRNRMRALGVEHYLAKPVELQDLSDSVRVVIAHGGHAAPRV